jgi:hypothetical protein
MSLSDLMEKLGKTIFEAPFDATMAPQDAPELAEIRLVISNRKSERVLRERISGFRRILKLRSQRAENFQPPKKNGSGWKPSHDRDESQVRLREKPGS